MVSIIIPCYNYEQYIAQAIESALSQTYSDVEVIVVNDGSTDSSAEAITPYADEITYIETENHGACHARNTGWRRATGRYIKFLDADDTLYIDAIEKQVAQSEERDDNDHVVFGDARYVTEEGTIVNEEKKPSRDGNVTEDEYLLANNIQTARPLHRRALLQAVGGFDEELPRAQEYDLHLRLALHGARFIYCPGQVVTVQVHEGHDRISNQNFFREQPRSRLSRLKDRISMIESADAMTEGIRKQMAHDAWFGGRMALQAGHRGVAVEYFGLAQAMHSDPIQSPSTLYRWAVRFWGPYMAERLVSLARNLRISR